jgi:septum site-determining protein MinC
MKLITTSALEIKGNLLTIMVLHLFESDTEIIAEQLAEKVSKAPKSFQQAPIVIDLQAVQNDNDGVDLPEIVRLLRAYGLIPVAVRGGNPQQHETALGLNLGLLADATSGQKPPYDPAASIPPMTRIITQPVRSGQQVVALNGDLIVLSTVSHGAEILAHRHIHIYGTLRGRALAGINGDHKARIFCQNLEAELISIAGQYKVNEDISEDLMGKPVHVYLDETSLKIKPL